MIAMELPLRLDFEFARRDLEKGRAGASRPLSAMRIDYFPASAASMISPFFGA
jgi:hypothetical protein